MTVVARVPASDWPSVRIVLLDKYTAWLSSNTPTTNLTTMDEPNSTIVPDIDDNRPIALRRKRRSSSVTNNSRSTDHWSRLQGRPDHTDGSADNATVDPLSTTTPSKPGRKKVRFSDPGPDTASSIAGDASTGLTPAVRRTSLNTTPYFSDSSRSSTPSRRRSAPGTPHPGFYLSGQVQFTPLRQIVDERTKRRIRRNGLSEEINDIEHEKTLVRKVQQRDSQVEELKKEIQQLKDESNEEIREDNKIAELQEEVDRLKEEMRAMTPAADLEIDWNNVQVGPRQSVDQYGSESGDTIPLLDHEDEEEMSTNANTMDDSRSPSRSQSLASSSKDADAQVDLPDLQHEAELLGVALDLEASKQEKRQLFSDVRSFLPAGATRSGDFPSSQLPSDSNRFDSKLPSPPANFFKQLSQTLKTTQSRAEDAELAFCALETELKTLGFPGDGADEVLGEMKRQFRSTRLELERLVPGETPAAFENAQLLSALVSRIRALVTQSRDRERQMNGILQREGVLKGQFDKSLERYEKAERRIRYLEETIEIGSEDMLHTRQKIQAMEHDAEDKDKNVHSLITALDKYRTDIRSLEELITRMEAEGLARSKVAKEESDEAIADLECKVAAEERGRRAAEEAAIQRGHRIKELEDGLASTTRQAMDVQVQVDSLRTEKDEAMSRLQRKIDSKEEQHETQLGQLNSHVASLTTALADAQAENEKLQASKERLEKRLNSEIEQAERTVESMQHDLIRTVAKFNESKKALNRGMKVRQANSEIEEEESEGGSSAPMTPVSLVRFVDVEVGRGKNRRKYDSGIGLSSEDDEIQIYEDPDADVDTDMVER